MSRINVADLSTGGEVGGGVPRVCALVFFASASFRRPGHRIGGPRRAWRIVRSRPRAAVRWASINVVKVLSRSRIAHCAINSGHCVMEVAFQGIGFHGLTDYILNKPGLICYLSVPIDRPIELRRFEHMVDERQHWPRWLASWLTRGRVESRNCVWCVRQALKQGGVVTPDRITTPKQLHDWLVRHGATREVLE